MVVSAEQDMIVPVALFAGKDDRQPERHSLAWASLARRLCQYEERLAKDGRAWSPVTYRPGTTRGKANVAQVHALVLDIDHSGIPSDLLEGLEYVAHTTFSHSANDPRWRVVLPLVSPIEGQDWPDFWLRANAHFGGCVDPQTKDSSRIFYLPSCRPDSTHESKIQHGIFLDPSSLPAVPQYERPPIALKQKPRLVNDGLGVWADRFFEAKLGQLAAMQKDTGRNAQTNRLAYLVGGLIANGRHGLLEADVRQELLGACMQNGLLADDGQRSVEATIRSGLDAGLQKPWSPADQEEPPAVQARLSTKINGHIQVKPRDVQVNGDRLRLSIVRMADVQPEPIDWLWRGRFARGKATLLMGDPGLGKSLISHWTAATVSKGGDWPDGGVCERGTVILFTIEDGLSDTVAPRLLAAGADMHQVIAVRGVVDSDSSIDERMFTLTQHLALLEELVTENKAIMVVMDPVTAYLGPDVNSHKEADVRAVLGPLQLLAERTRIVLVMLMHLNKGTGVSALYRATGSIAFPAVARIVLGIAPDPNDDEGKRRLLLPVKMNIGKLPEGIGYHIETAPTTSILRTATAEDQPPVLIWDQDPVGVDATSAMDRNGSVQEMGAIAETKQALIEILSGGRVTASECKRQLRESVGVTSETSLSRARKELGVRVRKDGFGGGGVWYWELAAKSLARARAYESMEPMEPLEPSHGCSKATKAIKGSIDFLADTRAREVTGNSSATDASSVPPNTPVTAVTTKCRACGRSFESHGARDPIACQWKE